MIPLGILASSRHFDDGPPAPEPLPILPKDSWSRSAGGYVVGIETLPGDQILVYHSIRSNVVPSISLSDAAGNSYVELGRVMTTDSSASLFAFMCYNSNPTSRIDVNTGLSVAQFTEAYVMTGVGSATVFGGPAGEAELTKEFPVPVIADDLLFVAFNSAVTNRTWQFEGVDYVGAPPTVMTQVTTHVMNKRIVENSTETPRWRRISGTPAGTNVLATRLQPHR